MMNLEEMTMTSRATKLAIWVSGFSVGFLVAAAMFGWVLPHFLAAMK